MTDIPNIQEIERLVAEARALEVELDSEGLAYQFRRTIERTMSRFVSAPDDLPLLKLVNAAAGLARSLPLQIDLWRVQNLYYELIQTEYPALRHRALKGDPEADEGLAQFLSLGEHLSMRVQ